MSQEERNEEAEKAREFERLRGQGVSLQDIGVGYAKGKDVHDLAVAAGIDQEAESPGEREISEKVEDKAGVKHVEVV